MLKNCVFLFITTLLVASYEATKYEKLTKLHRKLFIDDEEDYSPKIYNPRVIPTTNENALEVMALLFMRQILDFDVKTQSMKSKLWLHLSWYDARLRWNKDDYEGIDSFNIDPSLIWVPDVYLSNTIDGQLGLPKEGQSMVRAKVKSDGYVEWIPQVTAETRCELTLYYFPFDQQLCSINLSSDYEFTDMILSTPSSNDVNNVINNLNFYEVNHSWEVTDYKIYDKVDMGHNNIKLFLFLKRNSLIIEWNHLTVVCFLCILSIILFSSLKSVEKIKDRTIGATPMDRTEHRNYNLGILGLFATLITATAVYQLIFVEYLPVGADKLPVLGQITSFVVYLIFFASIFIASYLCCNWNASSSAPLSRQWNILFIAKICYGVACIALIMSIVVVSCVGKSGHQKKELYSKVEVILKKVY